MNYFLGIDATTGVLVADFEDTATGGNHPVAGTTAIAAGPSWHHAAATYDGTTWRLYLDGKLDERLVVGSFTPRSDSIQHAALGTAMNSTGVAAGFFQGVLDEVRIWNFARTGAQIRRAEGRRVVGSQPGLLGRWSLDEGAGTTVGDTSGNGVDGTAVGGPAWVAPYDFPQDGTAPAAPTGLGVDTGRRAGRAVLDRERRARPRRLQRLPRYELARLHVRDAVERRDLIRTTTYRGQRRYERHDLLLRVVAVDAANNASAPSSEASATPSPVGSNGLQLDGTNQYVTFGAAPGLATPTFTLETWFMRTGAGVGQRRAAAGSRARFR